jgi:hypothetical protein
MAPPIAPPQLTDRIDTIGKRKEGVEEVPEKTTLI